MMASSDQPAKNPLHFWVRHETKHRERRTALLPGLARRLLDAGHRVTVEKSNMRCIPDAEYAAAGCTMVEPETWPQDAPKEAIILGLKDVPADVPLHHRHIFFGHCYKQQGGWDTLMQRFHHDGGRLYDLEFVIDEATNRRVAAFGRSAGYIGASIGLMHWAYQQRGQMHPGFTDPYATFQDLSTDVAALIRDAPRPPRIVVIGALGRCGGGAVQAALAAGVPDQSIAKWDMAETKAGGPFPDLLQYDILVNCILMTVKIPSFMTSDLLQTTAGRSMSVIVDVSCDTTNPHNPLPMCNVNTSFQEPAKRLYSADAAKDQPALDIIAIDHTPALVPFESSKEFATDLFPSLTTFLQDQHDKYFAQGDRLFDERMQEALKPSTEAHHA